MGISESSFDLPSNQRAAVRVSIAHQIFIPAQRARAGPKKIPSLYPPKIAAMAMATTDASTDCNASLGRKAAPTKGGGRGRGSCLIAGDGPGTGKRATPRIVPSAANPLCRLCQFQPLYEQSLTQKGCFPWQNRT
jgi:hypothetical protein